MKKILLSAAIAGLLFSCSDRTQDNITALTDEIKTEAVTIKGETVCTFPDTAFVNAAWMANDRYAFCRTVTGPTGLSAQAYAVQVRDTRTLEQIAGYIHAGQRPFRGDFAHCPHHWRHSLRHGLFERQPVSLYPWTAHTTTPGQ